jgi:IclR family transcriptional regulator, pca regulon regulatory protein
MFVDRTSVRIRPRNDGACKPAEPMPRIRRSAAEQQMADAVGPEFLEALARGLRVIEAFNQNNKRLTLSDLAKHVDLPRASVRRTLYTLVKLGYAERDDRLFRLTPRVLTLASAYLSSNSISEILQPALDALSEDVQQSCSAAVLDGDDVMMIAHASPKRVIPVSAQIGFRLPAVATALGRVLLAGLDDKSLDRFLARAQPRKLTKFTVTDKSDLRKLIAKARTDGYALADQEAELGFRSMAVPLKRLDGKIIASLNIGVHSEHMPLKSMHAHFFPKLRDLADRLQTQLI